MATITGFSPGEVCALAVRAAEKANHEKRRRDWVSPQELDVVAMRRGLTANEVAALPPGLVAAIDVARVELVAAHLWVSWLAMLIGRGAQIVVRGRRIFWPRLPADLSRDPASLAVLAHELTHVWQYANGMTLWRYIWRERGRYSYGLDGRPFEAYGYEQQASMVEDWVRLRSGLTPRHSERPVGPADLADIVPFAASGV